MSVYIASVMSVFKPLLFYGMKETRIDGLPLLLNLLDRNGQDRKRGLITSTSIYSLLPPPGLIISQNIMWLMKKKEKKKLKSLLMVLLRIVEWRITDSIEPHLDVCKEDEALSTVSFRNQ